MILFILFLKQRHLILKTRSKQLSYKKCKRGHTLLCTFEQSWFLTVFFHPYLHGKCLLISQSHAQISLLVSRSFFFLSSFLLSPLNELCSILRYINMMSIFIITLPLCAVMNGLRVCFPHWIVTSSVVKRISC